MEDFIYHGELFNIYKTLLNESNCKYYSLYYDENLSLQEIADLENVSKSYVGNIIKKTTEKLIEYETNLQIYESKKRLREIRELNDLEKIKKEINKIVG